MCSCNRFQDIRVGLAAIIAFISLNHRDRRRPDMYTNVPGDQWWRHLLISMGLATSDDVTVFMSVLGLLLFLWFSLIKAKIVAKPTWIFWKHLQEHVMQAISCHMPGRHLACHNTWCALELVVLTSGVSRSQETGGQSSFRKCVHRTVLHKCLSKSVYQISSLLALSNGLV